MSCGVTKHCVFLVFPLGLLRLCHLFLRGCNAGWQNLAFFWFFRSTLSSLPPFPSWVSFGLTKPCVFLVFSLGLVRLCHLFLHFRFSADCRTLFFALLLCLFRVLRTAARRLPGTGNHFHLLDKICSGLLCVPLKKCEAAQTHFGSRWRNKRKAKAFFCFLDFIKHPNARRFFFVRRCCVLGRTFRKMSLIVRLMGGSKTGGIVYHARKRGTRRPRVFPRKGPCSSVTYYRCASLLAQLQFARRRQSAGRGGGRVGDAIIYSGELVAPRGSGGPRFCGAREKLPSLAWGHPPSHRDRLVQGARPSSDRWPLRTFCG